MKQEIMRRQWHQLDHEQIICTWLQTDNHASKITFLLVGFALPDTQLTVSKHWKSYKVKHLLESEPECIY